MATATSVIPDVQIEDKTFSRLMLGHNPFLGYSYYSDALAKQYEQRFRDPAAIEAVMRAAFATGVHGMMLSFAGGGGEAIVEALARVTDSLGITIPTVAILDLEFAQYRDMARRANTQVGVLHGQITDALFRKGTRDFAPEFADFMARLRDFGLVPGASTHNAGETVPAMAAYDVAVVNTPVNKIGWRMCPCPEQVISALAATKMTVIGMKPLAMGRIPPAEAMEYALSRSEVDIVLAGAAAPEEAEETFGAGVQIISRQHQQRS